MEIHPFTIKPPRWAIQTEDIDMKKLLEADYVPRSFYVPHARVQYTGQLVNPITGEVYTPEVRTKQSFMDECDINNIMKQFGRTGQITHIKANASAGAYVDLPDEIDFQSALETVRQGEASFASLPAKVRDRFNNSPAAFLEFMADPKNAKEMVELGLATVTQPPNPTPTPTPVASPSDSSPQPQNPQK